MASRKLENIRARYVSFDNVDISHCVFENSDFIDSFFDNKTLAKKANFQNVNFADMYLSLDYRQSEIRFTKIQNELHHLITSSNDTDWLENNNLIKITAYETLICLCSPDFLQAKNSVVYWQTKINSPRLINLSIEANNIIHVLTVEGETIDIDIETGKVIPVQNQDYFMTWKNADFKGATGLDARTAYFLRLLGAINVPKIADEYDPYEDPEIVPSLRQE